MNPPTALSNKYTTLSFKKSMYHCWEWESKKKPFTELKKTLLVQKCLKVLTEVSILEAKQTPKATKNTKNEEIIPFTITINPNNPKFFSIT